MQAGGCPTRRPGSCELKTALLKSLFRVSMSIGATRLIAVSMPAADVILLARYEQDDRWAGQFVESIPQSQYFCDPWVLGEITAQPKYFSRLDKRSASVRLSMPMAPLKFRFHSACPEQEGRAGRRKQSLADTPMPNMRRVSQSLRWCSTVFTEMNPINKTEWPAVCLVVASTGKPSVLQGLEVQQRDPCFPRRTSSRVSAAA